MPLNVKSISVSGAVICFFAIAVIGGISGFSTFTCCKRALMAAMIAYIVTTVAVKAINAILIDAIIKSQIDRAEEKAGDSGD